MIQMLKNKQTRALGFIILMAIILISFMIVDGILQIVWDITALAIPVDMLGMGFNLYFMFYFSYACFKRYKGYDQMKESSEQYREMYEKEKDAWALIAVELPPPIDYRKEYRSMIVMNVVTVAVNAFSFWWVLCDYL